MAKQKYAVIGHPIGHTMSPFIHKRLFSLSGIDAEYSVYDIPPEELEKKFKEELQYLNGFNITIPHKQGIILNPWPSAYTYLSGKTLKIWKATVHPGNTDAAPGTVVKADKQNLVIQTGVDRLSLEEVQLEGKKRMPVADFLRGFTIENGTVLGTKQP